jgi:hypothetical protein
MESKHSNCDQRTDLKGECSYIRAEEEMQRQSSACSQ